MIVYRNDDLYGSGVTSLEDIICHEIAELGNTDILTYCLDNYDIPDNLSTRIALLVDLVDDGEEFDESVIRDIARQLIDVVNKEIGFNYKYAIWGCAKKADVVKYYEGNNDNITEYYVNNPAIFSNLGEEGFLIASSTPIKPSLAR